MNQQAKIIFDCHQNRMLENYKCQHPTGPWGGGGKQKEDAVKLGGGPPGRNHKYRGNHIMVFKA